MKGRFPLTIQLSDRFTYRKLVFFTLPSIAMMIVTSIYGVVDGFFISNYCKETAFSAVNIIMPLTMILGTVGFMFGTGGCALVARFLGEGDRARANRTFSLIIYLSLVLGLLVATVGYIGMPTFAEWLGATGNLHAYAVTYGRINMIALPAWILQLEFHSFFVAAEKPQYGLFFTVAAGVTNMVLDAVLIPLYGVAGAAVATGAGQLIGGLCPLLYFALSKNSPIRLGKTRFDGGAVFKTVTNGSSEFLNNISMSFVSILYNRQLLRYAGEQGVAAYGVLMYLGFIFAAVFIGYSIGSAPVVSFHYGANHYDELKNLRQKSLRLIAASSLCMVIVALALAGPLADLFVGYNAALAEMTRRAFYIYAFSFAFMGVAIFGSGFFTALNDGLTSAIISFTRTVVFQASAVLLLPLILGVNGIWLSVVVSEGLAVAVVAVFLIAKRSRYHY